MTRDLFAALQEEVLQAVECHQPYVGVNVLQTRHHLLQPRVVLLLRLLRQGRPQALGEGPRQSPAWQLVRGVGLIGVVAVRFGKG